jgi:hypothetical protein
VDPSRYVLALCDEEARLNTYVDVYMLWCQWRVFPLDTLDVILSFVEFLDSRWHLVLEGPDGPTGVITRVDVGEDGGTSYSYNLHFGCELNIRRADDSDDDDEDVFFLGLTEGRGRELSFPCAQDAQSIRTSQFVNFHITLLRLALEARAFTMFAPYFSCHSTWQL